MKSVKKLIEIISNVKLFNMLLCCVLFLTSLNFVYASQINKYEKLFLLAEDPSKTPDTDLTTSKQEEGDSIEDSSELEDLDKSNIKTNIYKSNDPSFELIDDDTKLDSNTEIDILNKEDLLKTSKPGKNKIVKRHKNKDSNVTVSVSNKNHMILPWLVSLVLILLLSIIFKIVLQKKI